MVWRRDSKTRFGIGVHISAIKSDSSPGRIQAEMNEKPVDTNGIVGYYFGYDYDENCEF